MRSFVLVVRTRNLGTHTTAAAHGRSRGAAIIIVIIIIIIIIIVIESWLRDGLRNRVTLTFDFLTSGSMHAELLPYSICVPNLVLVARVVFLVERGQTQTRHTKSQMPLITVRMHTLTSWIMSVLSSSTVISAVDYFLSIFTKKSNIAIGTRLSSRVSDRTNRYHLI